MASAPSPNAISPDGAPEPPETMVITLDPSYVLDGKIMVFSIVGIFALAMIYLLVSYICRKARRR
uniref:Uncharacterized protein n=1 Tax=Daucus carota subsp. sativus TaxID=79200 RepID=A0A161XUH5_DAUCS